MRLFLSVLCLLVFACSSPQPVVNVEFRVAKVAPADGFKKYSFNETGQIFYLGSPADLSRKDIKDASVEMSNDKYFIDVAFTRAGAERFATLTGENIGNRIAILVDREIVAVPTVRDTIKQGKAIITGNFSGNKAEKIAKGIVGASE